MTMCTAYTQWLSVHFTVFVLGQVKEYYGQIKPFAWLSFIFLSICHYFKVIKLFLKVFHLPGYMVGRCVEHFCEQDLLRWQLCCQKSLYSTSKSVQQYAFPNLICSSEPFFLGPFSQSFDRGLLGQLPQNKSIFKTSLYCRFKWQLLVRGET